MAQRQVPKAFINLLLIGNTGQGKSATGNSILDKNCFISRPSTTSTTQKTEICQSDEGKIRVVDTVGVCDPDSKESIPDQIKAAMTSAMKYCNNGYHAVLLVFRYGTMSREDKAIVSSLPNIYGKDFLKKYCIIIITYGDNFEKDTEETGETFETWCNQQGPDFKKFLDECGNRILIFYNKLKDKAKSDEQRKRLLDMVIEFQLTNGTRLTKEVFQALLPRPQEQKPRPQQPNPRPQQNDSWCSLS